MKTHVISNENSIAIEIRCGDPALSSGFLVTSGFSGKFSARNFEKWDSANNSKLITCLAGEIRTFKMYREIYNLKNDPDYIRLIQKAALSEDYRIGLKTENGLLFGSNEWFCAINNGAISRQIVCGCISKVYMSGHNDFPEFEVTDTDGVKTVWERKGRDAYYAEGREVEIIYVSQKLKMGCVSNCVIKISVG